MGTRRGGGLAVGQYVAADGLTPKAREVLEGAGKVSTYRLTREQFDAGAAMAGDLPVVESEDGDLYAYGHADPAAFVAAAEAWWRSLGGDPADYDLDASSVAHRWAVCTIPADHPDGWWISWASDITQETPNAFPLTIVTA